MKRIIIYLLLGLFSSFELSAQVAKLSELKDVLYVDSVRYFVDETNSLSINEINNLLHEKKFNRSTSFDEILGIGKYSFWIVIDVENNTGTLQDVVFEVAMARLNDFTLYVETNEGIKRVGACGGLHTPIEQKPLQSYSHALQYSLPISVKQRFFVKLHKFPGSVRNALLLHTSYHFKQKQREINTNMSFYIALVLVVLISSALIWIYTKNRSSLFFTVVIALKSFLTLQFGEYIHIGFGKFSSSVLLLLILFLQYLFFNAYFKEKANKYLIASILVWVLIDFLLGFELQKYFFYYIVSYVFVLFVAFIFSIQIIKRVSIYQPKDYLFVVTQIAPIIILITVIVGYKINFANNFFRKFDHQFIYYFSLVEVLLYLVYLIKGLIELNKESRHNAEKLTILQNELITTQETERKKIAADLHDDLGSTLAVLKATISKQNISKEATDLVTKAIDDLRNITHNLMPVDFETFGFIASLEKHIEKLNNLGMKITLIVFGSKREMGSSVELNIYRIITEILHNIKKHSHSKEATLQLIYRAECLYISVENIESKKINEKRYAGIGEKTITSRLEYLHARILEKGEIKNGYSYIVEIPYEKNSFSRRSSNI